MQAPEKLRRTPRQARAQQTVDGILEAAAYMLSEQGLEDFTTNRVAERAGVNIASLYNFYRTKEPFWRNCRPVIAPRPMRVTGNWPIAYEICP